MGNNICCCGGNELQTVPLNESDYNQKSRRSLKCKIFIWFLIVLISLLVLAFIILFVALPLVFQNTVSLQRMVMFLDYDQPSDPQYNNFELYGAEGVRNMNITVDDMLNPKQPISLGVWQVLPKDDLSDPQNDGSDEYFERKLRYSTKPIVIYFHGQSGTRIFPLPTYNKLREYFHVIAMDYRHYGDSTEGELTEQAVVNDLVQFYKHILKRTNESVKIYFWGHSLGTALSTHTLKRLTLENPTYKPYMLPRALILEAPFTTMREEISYHPLGKFFSWLPWFESTVLDPLEANGFLFRTSENILAVEAPIMIIHSMDDSVIPFRLGEKLYKVAKEAGKNVVLHLIPPVARCNHMNINTYPGFLDFIKQFLTSIGELRRAHV